MLYMKPEIACQDCGQNHELPFSQTVVKLYQDFVNSSSQEERVRLASQIAEAYAAEHDRTDPSASEDYHQYFEEYEEARAKLDQAGLKLARLAVHVIGEFLSHHRVDIDTVNTDRSTN